MRNTLDEDKLKDSLRRPSTLLASTMECKASNLLGYSKAEVVGNFYSLCYHCDERRDIC